MRLAWHSPLLFLGLFLGLLPFVLLAIFLTKRMKVQAGLCPVHIRRRRNVILSASLGVAAGVVIFFTGAVSDAGGGLILVGFVVLMSAILYGIFASRVLKAKKIDKQFAWIKGVCPQYLAELPAFHA